jgi:hypothetical protein
MLLLYTGDMCHIWYLSVHNVPDGYFNPHGASRRRAQKNNSQVDYYTSLICNGMHCVVLLPAGPLPLSMINGSAPDLVHLVSHEHERLEHSHEHRP